jgi:hypothetical protein
LSRSSSCSIAGSKMPSLTHLVTISWASPSLR